MTKKKTVKRRGGFRGVKNGGGKTRMPEFVYPVHDVEKMTLAQMIDELVFRGQHVGHGVACVNDKPERIVAIRDYLSELIMAGSIAHNDVAARLMGYGEDEDRFLESVGWDIEMAKSKEGVRVKDQKPELEEEVDA